MALGADVTQEPLPPPAPVRERPDHRLPPRQWVRANLFNSPLNSVLTVVFGAVLAWVAYRIVRFVFVAAEWEVVRRNLRLFMIGRFPVSEVWRLWAALYLLAATVGFAIGAAAKVVEPTAGGDEPERPNRVMATAARFWPLLVLAVAILALTRTVVPSLLLAGGVVVLLVTRRAATALPRSVTRFTWLVTLVALVGALQVITASGGVVWDDWGGLHLTFFVTVGGIVAAFPLGLVLALARRSSMPAVRWLAVAYIELFRGVPLLTLLFAGQFVILFFFPTYLDPPGLLIRAMIAIVAFEAAYIAEVVRGGLQSVPRGQYEAAQALGLRPTKAMRRVVLPQALRAVIPALVGQFISLYKDTSLLSILAIFEILRVAGAVVTQPDFLGQGLDAETLAFVGLIYWAGCYTMSKESRRIERRLGVGER